MDPLVPPMSVALRSAKIKRSVFLHLQSGVYEKLQGFGLVRIESLPDRTLAVSTNHSKILAKPNPCGFHIKILAKCNPCNFHKSLEIKATSLLNPIPVVARKSFNILGSNGFCGLPSNMTADFQD